MTECSMYVTGLTPFFLRVHCAHHCDAPSQFATHPTNCMLLLHAGALSVRWQGRKPSHHTSCTDLRNSLCALGRRQAHPQRNMATIQTILPPRAHMQRQLMPHNTGPLAHLIFLRAQAGSVLQFFFEEATQPLFADLGIDP